MVEKIDFDISRTEMGWSKKFGVDYNHLPEFSSMRRFIDNLDNSFVHVFGGIRSSRNLRRIIRYLLINGKRVFVQSEAPNYFGLNGLYRILRVPIDNFLFYRKIEAVFAIGSLGFEFYRKNLPRECKVFPWAYFIAEANLQTEAKNSSGRFNILYLGSLTKTKGVIYLLRALANIDLDFHLSIIGNGPELGKLRKFVSAGPHLKDKVTFKGFIQNNGVQDIMATQDLLVLPSINKDGWGVVVSEALSVGTPVIVSEKCGSAVLLSDPIRGSIVEAANVASLRNAIIIQMEKGKVKKKTRDEIVKWAKCLSATKAAEFMIDCINKKDTTAPWL
ncbi:glycosyltransferase [Akkermansiaceae bacterium]|nr:glycosyltransferase [Akkermansiaceae bacterium]